MKAPAWSRCIDPLTLCIDLDRAAELIGPATRAVVLMDYGPHLCDHAAAAALAEEGGLRTVHDAAHAFGSAYHGSGAVPANVSRWPTTTTSSPSPSSFKRPASSATDRRLPSMNEAR